MNSYYSNQNSHTITEYKKRTTYLQENDQMAHEPDSYLLLPEEYDVFTFIDKELFTKQNTVQDQLISDCLSYLKSILLAASGSKGTQAVLPKIFASKEEDGTIIFNWAYSTFRAFLSFDNEIGGYDAYCGIVSQSNEESVETYSRKITGENYEIAISELVSKIFQLL